MANTILIKRSTGSSAPASLTNGELAFAEGSGILYYGDAAGTPIQIGGAGFIQAAADAASAAALSSANAYTDSAAANLSGYVDSTATSLSGYVDSTATSLSGYVDSTASGLSSYVDTTVSGLSSYVDSTASGLSSYVDSTASGLSSYVDTKSDAASAAALSSANAYTDTAVANLVNSAPEVLDTLAELASALSGDASFAATIAGQIGELSAALSEGDLGTLVSQVSTISADLDSAESNIGTLSTDLGTVSANLATVSGDLDTLESSVSSSFSAIGGNGMMLGDMALQNKSTVDITGGTIDSVVVSNSTIDGGSF
jgi:phage-related protein